MEIQHRISRLHSNADGLSRRPETLKKCCDRLECPECLTDLSGPNTESTQVEKHEKPAASPVIPSPNPVKNPENPAEAVKPRPDLAESFKTGSGNQNLGSVVTSGEATGTQRQNTRPAVDPARRVNPERQYSRSEVKSHVAQAGSESDSSQNDGESAVGTEDRSRMESNWLQSWSQDELRGVQESDPEVSQVLELRQMNARPSWAELQEFSPGVRALCSMWKCLVISDGLLCREWTPSFADPAAIDRATNNQKGDNAPPP